MSILGCIADSTTVDTVSTNPTASYPIQSHVVGILHVIPFTVMVQD